MMLTMQRLFATLFIALLGAGALSGCNTIRGAGEDVEAAGSAVSQAAEETEEELEDEDDDWD